MPKGTQLFENTLAGLAALAIVLVCTSSLQGQAGFVLKSTATASALPVGKTAGIDVQEIRIATHYKEQLVWDLARFGVHRAMLFPDIDGLAGHIRWMYETFEHSKAPPE